MKDKIFAVLQRVGRSFMLPIAILPIAGLFLGIGGSFTNETMLETYGLTQIMGKGTVIYSILTVLRATGSVVFDNLPLIFAIGVAIGMAKKEKETAALAGAIAFLVMHASIGALIAVTGGTNKMLAGSTTSVLGITSLQMGVFGGIIVGLGVAALHNRFYKIQLPQVLSFFGGSRFVPIISSVVYLIVGIAMFYFWPTIQAGIFYVGGLVRNSGYGGTLIYGIMERALIPFGLHHVFYLPFWQTGVGGSAVINGTLVEGAQNIFFAELATPGIEHFNVEATRFMSGKFPLMIFGLPGAALAMYKCAKLEKRKVVGGLLLSAALTSILTGITEPLEFTFLFVAPILYVIHCFFAGLAYMLMHILHVGVGMTFSGGFIDMTLFGILQGNAKTDWINIVFVGIGYFILYYFMFSFLIKKFNYKTPGREEGNEETKLYTRADVNAKKEVTNEKSKDNDPISALIINGLGGKNNISDLDCCATRLRITVDDPSKVDETLLKQSGAAGVIKKGNGVQVIYGPKVTVIKSNLEDYIAMPESEMLDMNYETNNEIKEETKNVLETISNENTPSTNPVKVHAALKGVLIPLEKVEDEVFSKGIVGVGMAIEPTEGSVFSPVDGTIENIFDTKHAVGIISKDGADILIHIGLDTVKLNGKYFNVHVKQGDKVRQGDLLVTFDIEGIQSEGYKATTPIIACNGDIYKNYEFVREGKISVGELMYKMMN